MRDRTALIAVSHGTADPYGQQRIAALAHRVRTRTAAEVLLAHVDVQAPRVGQVVAGLAEHRGVVVVPLLLSAGYHVKVDLREAARGLPVAPALGPDDRLVEILTQRALTAGFTRGHHQVVLASAGSTDAGAIADCRAVADGVAERLGIPVADAYLSAARPDVAAAVGAARHWAPEWPVLVLSYLLAPGYFQSRLVAEAAAAGAVATTDPLLGELGPVPEELVDLVMSRYRATVERCSIPGRTVRRPTASRC